MSIGSRIKRFRTYRGKTMKEIGMGLGMSERTSDVRMAQYESGTRVPKKDILEKIAFGLHVNPDAIDIPDPSTNNGFIFNLFEYFHLYGLHPTEVNKKILLEFDPDVIPTEDMDVLKDWFDEYNNYTQGKITKEQYIDWLLSYPAYSKNLHNNSRAKWLGKSK
ncbi:MAG: XRE family transcriptional regulator [Erysipelotrichaceae bacterium]|nr:XRE family transcriptional regulator [Erysipelotrichaceae bacterium]